jgi:hypothetical protein
MLRRAKAYDALDEWESVFGGKVKRPHRAVAAKYEEVADFTAADADYITELRHRLGYV